MGIMNPRSFSKSYDPSFYDLAFFQYATTDGSTRNSNMIFPALGVCVFAKRLRIFYRFQKEEFHRSLRAGRVHFSFDMYRASENASLHLPGLFQFLMISKPENAAVSSILSL